MPRRPHVRRRAHPLADDHDHPYQLPLGFKVEAYVQGALVVMSGRQIEMELLFDRPTAAWERDRVWHPRQSLTPLRDGRLRMMLRVAGSRSWSAGS